MARLRTMTKVRTAPTPDHYCPIKQPSQLHPRASYMTAHLDDLQRETELPTSRTERAPRALHRLEPQSFPLHRWANTNRHSPPPQFLLNAYCRRVKCAPS